MLYHLLDHSIVLLLLAQGAKCGSMGADASCADHLPAIQSALQETLNIANFAQYRSQGGLDGTLNLYPEMQVTSATFHAYFGKPGTDGLRATAEFLINVLKTIANLANSPQDLLVFCNDDFVVTSTVDEDNKPVPSGTTQYKFTPHQSGSPEVFLKPGFKKCGEDPDSDMDGYTLVEQGYVILCPDTVSTQGPTIDRTTDYSVPPNSLKLIDEVASVLSVTILHELCHLTFDSEMRFGSDELGGYDDCVDQSLNGSPEAVADVVHNPDCVALYAASLYLTANDWSSSLPMPLRMGP